MLTLSCTFILNVAFSQHVEYVDETFAKLALTSDNKEKVRLYNDLSSYYSNNDIQKSEEYASKAMELAKSVNYERGIADSYFATGRVFINTDYDLSFELISNALKIYENEKDTFRMAKCYNEFGTIKSGLKEYNSALEYYAKALEIFMIKKDTSQIAAELNNLGTCYAELGEFTKAITYFEQATSLNKKKNHKMWLSINYNNLGQIYITLKNHEKALYFLNESLKLKKELNEQNGMVGLYGIFGNLYYEEGLADSAFIYFFKANKLAKDLHNLRHQETLTKSISDTYKDIGAFDSAFVWLERHLSVRDSVLNTEKSNRIAMMEMRLRFESNQKSIAIEHHKNIYRLSIIIYSLSLVIMLSLMVIFFLNLRRKRIRLLNNKISIEKKYLEESNEQKNMEIASNMINLVSKNTLIKKIVDKLETNIYSISNENKTLIIEIISELNFNLNKDIWKEFEIRFTQVHPNFYNNLLREFPTLTPNEIKLCAFLRLNMASKEISQITHQNIESIEKARIRLRKKINISETGTSISYFLSSY